MAFRHLRVVLERAGFEYESERGLFVLSDPFRGLLASTLLAHGYRLPHSAGLLVFAPKLNRSTLAIFAGPLSAAQAEDDVLQLTDEAARNAGRLKRLLGAGADGSENAPEALPPALEAPPVLEERPIGSEGGLPDEVPISDQSFTQIARKLVRKSGGAPTGGAPTGGAPSDVVHVLESSASDSVSAGLADRMSREHSAQGNPVDAAFALARAGVHARDAARLRAALRVAVAASELECAREVVRMALGVVGDGPARHSWIEQLRALEPASSDGPEGD